MIYTNNHRRALNEHLARIHPDVYAKARPDSNGSLHLVCRELPSRCAQATMDDDIEDMALAYQRQHNRQMPVLIRVNNARSGELRVEYLVNYIDYRNARDMREAMLLTRQHRLFTIG